SRGQLAKHVRPTEAREQKAKLYRIERQLLLHRCACERERNAIAVAEGACDEQHRNDEVAYVRRFLDEYRSIQLVQERPAISALNASISLASRSVSGVRTGPAGRPTARIPALTIDTAYPLRRLRISIYGSTNSRSSLNTKPRSRRRTAA